MTTTIIGETMPTARGPRLLRLAEVLARTGLARSAVYAYIKSGAFPTPIPLAPESRAVGWIEREIEEWIVAQIRAARGSEWGRGIDGVSAENASNAA